MSLSALMVKGKFNFQQRAIARELSEMLCAKSAKEGLELDVDKMSAEWDVSPQAIWRVVDDLAAEGFWYRNELRDTLVLKLSPKSRSMSPKAAAKKKPKVDVQKAAEAARAAGMRLSDVRSASSATWRRIAEEERSEYIMKGYAGSFPSSAFYMNGATYAPDQAMTERLQAEYEGKDIEQAYVMMFEELRSPLKRPSVARFPYWIYAWMKKRVNDIPSSVRAEQVDALIAEKMSEF